jgi:hypothetical protein
MVLALALALAGTAPAAEKTGTRKTRVARTRPFPPSLDTSGLKEFQQKRLAEIWEVLEASRREKNFLKKREALKPHVARLRRMGTKSPAPLYLRGLIYQVLQDYTNAERTLQLVVELQPDFFGGRKSLAKVKLELARLPKGRAFLSKNRKHLLEDALAEVDKALKIKKDFNASFLRAQILVTWAQAMPDPNKAKGEVRNDTSKDWIEDPNYKKALKYLVSIIKTTPPRSPVRKQLLQLRLHVRQAFYGVPKPWKESGEFFVRRQKHYRVVTNHSQKIADELGEQANFIFRAYKAKIFTDIPAPQQVFNVFVYTNLKDYVKLGGGAPQSIGFYSPLTRILVVLYREDNPEQSILVLNHEAMHQFVHDNLNNAPMWFNEGLGDYFGPYERVGKSRMKSAPNTMRLNDHPSGALGIKTLMAKGLVADLRDLMLKTQAEFYDMRLIDPRTPAVSRNYAQAWSIMYFLHETKTGQGYMKHLLKYYSLLRKGRHFHEAFEESFGKIDLDAFRHDWEVAVQGF